MNCHVPCTQIPLANGTAADSAQSQRLRHRLPQPGLFPLKVAETTNLGITSHQIITQRNTAPPISHAAENSLH